MDDLTTYQTVFIPRYTSKNETFTFVAHYDDNIAPYFLFRDDLEGIFD